MGGFDDEEIAHFIPQWAAMPVEERSATVTRFREMMSAKSSAAALTRKNPGRLGPLVEQAGFAWGFLSALQAGFLDRLVRRRESLDQTEGDARELALLVSGLWEDTDIKIADAAQNPLVSALAWRNEQLVAIAYAQAMRLCSETQLSCVRLQHQRAQDVASFFCWALEAETLQRAMVKWQIVAWLKHLLSWSPLPGTDGASPIPELWSRLLETGSLDKVLAICTSSDDSVVRFSACSCIEHLVLQFCYLCTGDGGTMQEESAMAEYAHVRDWIKRANLRMQEKLREIDIEECWRSLDALRAVSAQCNVLRDSKNLLGCEIGQDVVDRLQPLAKAYVEKDSDASKKIRKLTEDETNALYSVAVVCSGGEDFSHMDRREHIREAYEISQRQRQGRACEECEAVTSDLKRCAGCRRVWFCSTECQKVHWRQHKLTCKATSLLASKIAAQQSEPQNILSKNECDSGGQQLLSVYPAAFVHWLLLCPSALRGKVTEATSFEPGCLEESDLDVIVR